MGVLPVGSLKSETQEELQLPGARAPPSARPSPAAGGSAAGGGKRPVPLPGPGPAPALRGDGVAQAAAAGGQRGAGRGRAGGSEVPQLGARPHEEAGSHPEGAGLLRSAAGERHDGGGEPLLPEGAALPHQPDGPPGCPAGLQPRGDGERAADPGQGTGVSLQVSDRRPGPARAEPHPGGSSLGPAAPRVWSV